VLTQQWLYSDQLRIVAEINGSVTSRFVYGTRSNVPDFMIRSGVTYRILSDHLGSPRLVVDVATGAVYERIDYDEFGNVTLDSNPGFTPFGFARGLYDHDTRVVRFGARDYDPAVGRWTVKDPILFFGMSPNLYAYTMSDPINLFDPSGLADLTFSAGFHVPIAPGVAVGPTFSSTSIGYFTAQQPTPGLSGLQPLPTTIEFALGLIADIGANVGVTGLSNSAGHCAAPFSVNLGLGKYFGIQVIPRTELDLSKSIFNPIRYFDAVSVGFGPPAFALPISVSGLNSK
jgi:RHS repeat-associated protein